MLCIHDPLLSSQSNVDHIQASAYAPDLLPCQAKTFRGAADDNVAQPLRPDAGAGRAQKDEIVWPPTVILENVLCRPSGSDFSKRDIYGETMHMPSHALT